LDAESETLVNHALAQLLKGNNTTISIAHRLSTIQRSDIIICIGADGKVAQVGPYAQLAADKEGAFAKLMEWQITGGEAPAGPSTHTTHGQEPRGEVREEDHKPELTEEDHMRIRLKEHDRAKSSDGAEEELGEGAVVRGEKETAAEAVLEKSKGSDR
jgi:putative ABC transport system ATP-binding protein